MSDGEVTGPAGTSGTSSQVPFAGPDGDSHPPNGISATRPVTPLNPGRRCGSTALA